MSLFNFKDLANEKSSAEKQEAKEHYRLRGRGRSDTFAYTGIPGFILRLTVIVIPDKS